MPFTELRFIKLNRLAFNRVYTWIFVMSVLRSTLSIGASILELPRTVLLTCNLVAEAATLRREVGVFTQALDSAKQELQLPVRSCGRILRDLSERVSNVTGHLLCLRCDSPCVQRGR
jgi:hypothetical protein